MPARADADRGHVPAVSVIVEGYNEARALGSATKTTRALCRQAYPLDQVELVLIGSQEQVWAWEAEFPDPAPFAAVRTLVADGAHYYDLKNRGAALARGEILAFTDSDARPAPGWLAAIVRAIQTGADVAGGVTLFSDEQNPGRATLLREIAGAITWGFIIGRETASGVVKANDFLSNNVGLRARVFRCHQYRTDLGRTCAGTLLHRSLQAGGATIVLQPEQRVIHSFSAGWWVKLHFRFGYEVYRLRRESGSTAPHWVRRTAWAEPVLTMLWHQARDLLHWFRFSRLVRRDKRRRYRLLPLVLAVSAAARSLETAGMYVTLVAPDAMRHYAEWH